MTKDDWRELWSAIRIVGFAIGLIAGSLLLGLFLALLIALPIAHLSIWVVENNHVKIAADIMGWTCLAVTLTALVTTVYAAKQRLKEHREET